MKQEERALDKKPYHKPKLRSYADLRVLTESNVSMTGASDGAYGQILKTA